MQLDIHVPRFTWPGGAGGDRADVRRPGPDGRGHRRAHPLGDGPLVPDGDAVAGRGADARGVHGALLRCRQDQRLRFRLLVGGVTYRHPGLLAKTITTLDVLSGGRAELGLGAAWYEREHRGLGVPFPPLSERYERLEETIQICFQMWSDDNGPYEGTHYQLAETLCSPSPVSTPRPRLLIGGGGERKTLRLVRNTPTPATSSATSRRSRTRSTCCGVTATRSVAIRRGRGDGVDRGGGRRRTGRDPA